MNVKETTSKCLDIMKSLSVDKGECTLILKDLYEFNVSNGEISLLRTTKDKSLNIRVIKDLREGSVSINKIDDKSIENAIKEALVMSKSSQEDECYDISPNQPVQEFNYGSKLPKLDEMYDSISAFCDDVKNQFKNIIFEEGTYEFEYKEKIYSNTNGVYLQSSSGNYGQSTVITAKDDKNTSSFNYTVQTMKDVEKDLINLGSVKRIMECAVEELNSIPLEDKFVGDIIITSEALDLFIWSYFQTFLSDVSLITGKSKLKDKLNKQVASEKLTIASLPFSEDIVAGAKITNDGFAAEDMTIIEKGILKSFLLSLYGSNKTGFDRAKNNGVNMVVSSGEHTIDEIIKNTKKGLIIGRFSGGNPSANGDFSGVAKNSFYVEDGEIKHALSETMISGNLYDMFNNVEQVSKERTNFGIYILPWIKCSGITISGKV